MDIIEIRRRATAQELDNTGAYYQEALQELLEMYDELTDRLQTCKEHLWEISNLCDIPNIT